MWYDSSMVNFKAINVPIHWAGQEKEVSGGGRVWACGACPDPDACLDAARCQRASDEDFNQARRALFGRNPE